MKIMVFGTPGSGKSSFAQVLSEELRLPFYQLDKYFFFENWKEKEHQEFLEIQEKLVENDDWVIVGNALHSLEMRYQRAHVAIYFSFCPFASLCRLFKKKC